MPANSCSSAKAADEAEKNEPAAHSRFERFAALSGELVGTAGESGSPGTDVRVKYKANSGRSAVVETIFPDSDGEMVTIVHRDCDEIALTHYCAMGNYPHMKALDKSDSNVVAFKFTHTTNMKSEKAMHMHDVTYTFVDKDTLKGEWRSFVDGKPAGGVVFKRKRKV